MQERQCFECNAPVDSEVRNYCDIASGLPNFFLQGVAVAERAAYEDSSVTILHLLKGHRAIALAILNSPRLLTGRQLTFLRKHAELKRSCPPSTLESRVDER